MAVLFISFGFRTQCVNVNVNVPTPAAAFAHSTALRAFCDESSIYAPSGAKLYGLNKQCGNSFRILRDDIGVDDRPR
jgi:hypothetical protein